MKVFLFCTGFCCRHCEVLYFHIEFRLYFYSIFESYSVVFSLLHVK